MENISISKEKFVDRLEAFMNDAKLNANKLTVAASLSNGLVGKTLKNRTTMNSDSIERILYAYPQLSADWLMTGRGNMYVSNSQEGSNNDSLTIYLIEKNKKLEAEVRELLGVKSSLITKLELFLDSGAKTGCG